MENDDGYWRRLLHTWTRSSDRGVSRSIVGNRTAINNEKNADNDSDDGRILYNRRSDELGRSSSFEDTSTASGRSGTDAITHSSKQFPPPVTFPMLVQSQRPQGQNSTPRAPKDPFVLPNAFMGPHVRRMAPGTDKPVGSGHWQTDPVPGNADHVPTNLSSPHSESSFSEVESDAAAESTTSLSKTQTRSLPLSAESQHGNQNPPRFDASYMSGSDGDNDSLSDREYTDPLKVVWRKLVGKKNEVDNTRAGIRGTRRSLQQARLNEDNEDNAFMACLRPILVNTGTPPAMLGHTLDHHIRRMQQTRDQYQTCEKLLESLEAKLDHDEKELDILERQLINELWVAPAYPIGHIESREPPPLPGIDGCQSRSDINSLPVPLEAVGGLQKTTTLPIVLLGIAAERTEDYHPLYNQFMSAIGYLQLAEEHNNDLLTRKLLIEEEQKRLRLTQDQQRQQEQLRLLAKNHEQARLRLAEEQERQSSRLVEEHEQQRSKLVEEQKQEISRLAEENPGDSGPLRAKKLRDEDLEFLRDFEVEERLASEDVRRLRDEVDRFKQLCQEKGLIPRHAPLHEVYSYERHYDDDISIDFDPQKDVDTAHHLANPRFTLLLSNPSHLMGDCPVTAKTALKQATKMPESDPRKAQVFGAAAKEFFIENLIRESRANDKADFINRWLLHKLRISPLEAELLWNCFFLESHLRVLNLDRWQQDVLYYWPRDDAAKLSPEDFIGPITPEGTQSQFGSSESPTGTTLSQSAGPLDEHTSVSIRQ
ncbi:hypothetical protein VMCG_04553 [Cytospora schulzeri]|uniref:Uncharacterized protein n=1 Tax=Cytospora schulzeri TaxID=448051 RepID=A0A423WRR3_9PEZI|nr:hypothetical protein VMCG_04553 [Valsa malicola]